MRRVTQRDSAQATAMLQEWAGKANLVMHASVWTAKATMQIVCLLLVRFAIIAALPIEYIPP